MPQLIALKLQRKPLKPLLALAAQWLEPGFGLDSPCRRPSPEHDFEPVVEPRKHMPRLDSQRPGLAPKPGNETVDQPLVQRHPVVDAYAGGPPELVHTL